MKLPEFRIKLFGLLGNGVNNRLTIHGKSPNTARMYANANGFKFGKGKELIFTTPPVPQYKTGGTAFTEV